MTVDPAPPAPARRPAPEGRPEDTSDLDYDLPPSAIAQQPAERRDGARLLVDRGAGPGPDHRRVTDLSALLDPGDLLVVNDTRVRRARLRLRKPTGGAVEVLLLHAVADAPPGTHEALVKPSRSVAPGTVLAGATAGEVAVTVGDDLGDGRRRVVVHGDAELVGEVPLPPYLHEPLADPERYQTVYARTAPTSAAAPTAGLHLTAAVLDVRRSRGVDIAAVELVVGLDTFRPVTVSRLDDHPMHTEGYDVPDATWDAVVAAKAAGRPVVAVGTTVVRALESVAATGERTGRTSLFIRRGHHFAAVDRILTNFHLPRTTLLCLLDAAIGDRWRTLYALALAEGYRFASFGDAMLVDVDPALARVGPGE